MYSSALDPSSALPETVISDKDLLHSMEGERLATLEQALAELQAKDANTQHKLDILISHIPQSENPIPSTQITSVTPKAHGLKPALPSELTETAPKEWRSLIPARSISVSVQTPLWTNKPKLSGPCHI